MNNAAYGKTCEGKRKRVKVKLVRDVEVFAAVTMQQTKIVWKKPTAIGSVILDLAKYYMFTFIIT